MRADARQRNGQVFRAKEKPAPRFQPLREISMHIHEDFPPHTMRPAQESDCQILRLAERRAWAFLISH
jgi:hypothetical protein